MDNLSPYRLTIVAAFIVIVLSSALVFILGGPTNAAPYLAFIGTVAVPTLLAIFRVEQNAVTQQVQHTENQTQLMALKKELDGK